MTNTTFDDEKADFLEHFGVRGMKWGRRKGSDGGSSATPRTHRQDEETGEITRGKYSPNASKDYVTAREAARKPASSLSNKEMQALVTRVNLEQQYNKLNPTTTGRGQKIAVDIVKKTGSQLMQAVVKETVNAVVGAVFQKGAKPKS